MKKKRGGPPFRLSWYCNSHPFLLSSVTSTVSFVTPTLWVIGFHFSPWLELFVLTYEDLNFILIIEKFLQRKKEKKKSLFFFFHSFLRPILRRMFFSENGRGTLDKNLPWSILLVLTALYWAISHAAHSSIKVGSAWLWGCVEKHAEFGILGAELV